MNAAEASEDSIPFVAIKLTGLCDSRLLVSCIAFVSILEN